MNTQNISTKLYVLLSLLILVMMGLVGCGTLEVGALPVDAASGYAEEAPGTGIQIGIEPTPIPETLTYTNNFYGFKFDYPKTWALSEIDHGVALTQGSNRLTINFRWENEVVAPFRTGMAAGTPIYSDKISFMGQVVPVYIVELDHQAKYVLYSEEGAIKVEDLVFTPVLEDLETDYMTLDLPETIIAESSLILGSFERIAVTEENPAVDLAQEPASTLPDPLSLYESRDYGFSFNYPSFMSVVEEPNKVLLNYDGNVQFTIAYRSADEGINISGMSEVPEELVSYGEVQFLGQPADVVLDIHNGLTKFVYLGVPGMELGENYPLRFVFSLMITDGGGISNAQVDQMLKVFENFKLTSSSYEENWQTAVEILNTGQVTEAYQTHSLQVTLTLADGRQIKTVEPSIDEIFREVELCGDSCRNIILVTE